MLVLGYGMKMMDLDNGYIKKKKMFNQNVD